MRVAIFATASTTENPAVPYEMQSLAVSSLPSDSTIGISFGASSRISSVSKTSVLRLRLEAASGA